MSPPTPLALGPTQFARLAELIRTHAGITLPETKRDMVQARLARRLRALGLTDFDAYIARLHAGDPAELDAFVHLLTTHHTAFYREPHHFDLLASWLAPRAHAPLTLWCAAAATGEEAYSLAFTLLDAGIAHARLLASDVDGTVLSQAALGIYPATAVEKIPPTQRQRYLVPLRDGRRQVHPDVRARIQWRRINLLAPPQDLPAPFDAIFCRNVLSYMDRDSQKLVAGHLHRLLKPDGRLFLGHAESLTHAGHLFRLVGRTVYAPVTPP